MTPGGEPRDQKSGSGLEELGNIVSREARLFFVGLRLARQLSSLRSFQTAHFI